jgi:ABC-type branched-subunit amino acid transport system ATPase component
MALAQRDLESAPTAPVLTARDIHLSFGSLNVLRGVSLDVSEGSVVGLIGPNGAGKSTLLNVIAGVLSVRIGTVEHRGADITRSTAASRARRGLRRTFQHVELFEDMTVEENVLVGAESADPFLTSRRNRQRRIEEVTALLESLEISEYAHVQARRLPHPVKRLVSYARGVAGRTDCLLLDEPVAGLGETERASFLTHLKRDIGRRQLTVIVVEHDMRFVEGLCNEIYVLSAGTMIANGTFKQVSESDAVKAAYLGSSE